MSSLIQILFFLRFRMALGTGGRCLFGLILFVELFVADPTILMQGFGVVIFYFFFFGKLLFGFLALGSFRRGFVAFDALLYIVPVF